MREVCCARRASAADMLRTALPCSCASTARAFPSIVCKRGFLQGLPRGRSALALACGGMHRTAGFAPAAAAPAPAAAAAAASSAVLSTRPSSSCVCAASLRRHTRRLLLFLRLFGCDFNHSLPRGRPRDKPPCDMCTRCFFSAAEDPILIRVTTEKVFKHATECLVSDFQSFQRVESCVPCSCCCCSMQLNRQTTTKQHRERRGGERG